MSFDSFYTQFDPSPDESSRSSPEPDPPPRRRPRRPEPEPEPVETPWPTKQAPSVGAHFQDEPVVKVKNPFVWTRRTILLAALGVAVVALGISYLTQPAGESVRAIRAHPEQFDGRQIMVRGKVGEVFPMGGSCAYNLHQGWAGRDTIVVFSRIRYPARGRPLIVHGTVSMGYLDGQARPALFEVAAE